jgi:hypothetical protein
LENVSPNPRRACRPHYDSSSVAGASAAGFAIRRCRPCRLRRAAIRDHFKAGDWITAIHHAAADEFLLLCCWQD